MAGKKPATPDPESDPTHARQPPPPLALRVREIRRRIEMGTWGPEATAELATTWGITEAMVRGHAAEASRQLEAVLDAQGAPRAIDADLTAALDLAFAQGDMGAVQRLLETKLKLYGIGAHRDARNNPQPASPPPAGSSAPGERSNVVALPPWKKKA